MVVLVLAHATQVFLHGAYKYPRELTWILGVVLLLCTLGMFFTGQVLRWDPDAYWGLAVGGSMAGRVPGMGPESVHLMLGSDTIGSAALSRFFSLHVFVIPGVLLVTLAAHLWLVLKCGISAAPKPGVTVDPAMVKDVFFSAVAVLVVVGLAAMLGPKGPTDPPDPMLAGANPRPEWPFLWLFALLSMSPPEAETFIILVLPLLLIVALLAVPFISNRGERAPSRRPFAVLLVVATYAVLGVLTYEGATAPWSPHMTAWSGEPVPVAMIEKATPVQLQGAAVLQYMNCRNCHALDGRGGKRGPDLSGIGTRLTPNQLIDQISNGTPGGGNMPAYGRQVSPHELAAMVEFLSSLRPEGQPPARGADEPPVQATP
jgi:ubiquinol-cytochrome c reductase cytochrome b subunit